MSLPNVFSAMIRSTLAASIIALSAWAAPVSAAEIGEISTDDYYGAYYFKNALEHPQISKIKSRKKQIKKVARDMKWKSKKLRAAIDKLDSLSGDPVELAKAAITEGFAASRVKGRILDVLVNAEEPKHVVVYVRWQATKRKEVVKDASAIANVIANKAPFISTLSISAIHPKAKKTSKKSVWSGKIGRASMERIDKNRIEDYADRLYKRMFEGVEEKPF